MTSQKHKNDKVFQSSINSVIKYFANQDSMEFTNHKCKMKNIKQNKFSKRSKEVIKTKQTKEKYYGN